MTDKERTALEKVEEDFVKMVKEIFAESLVSVILYGSYVEGHFTPGVSDINVLIILSRSDIGEFEKFQQTCGKFTEKHHITPLFLRKKEFLNSADVFPMEYMDIAERNRVLWGEDLTKELRVSSTHLRHQIEYTLRGSVHSLRQAVIAARGKERILGKSIKEYYGSYVTLFRSLLRLKEIKPIPHNHEEIVALLEKEFPFDKGPFLELKGYREGNKTDIRKLTAEVLAQLEELASAVDSMEGKQDEG